MTDPKHQPLYAYAKLPRALSELSALSMWGDAKHGKGPISTESTYLEKMQRHITRYMQGNTHDIESGFVEQLHIAFNALAQVEVMLADCELDHVLIRQEKVQLTNES